MEKETKFFLGKLLGETYRIQKHLNMNTASDSRIYGLVQGIESEIDAEMGELSPISDKDVSAMDAILNDWWGNKRDEFTGYYSIEPEIKAAGIDRATANRIISLFLSQEKFVEIIVKMDSQNSPIESKHFEIQV